MAELVFHDFRERADERRALRAREAVPFRRIELDLLLTEEALSAPGTEPALDVARLFAFARERDFDLFIHLVDASAYTDRSLDVLRRRLEGEGQLDDGTIIGSTHLAGLLRVKEVLPEVRNQGRFPVSGIRYVHKFGPDLLRALSEHRENREIREGFSTTTAALETLWDVALPPARRSAFDAMSLIASFDAIDKRTGEHLPLAEYADGAARLARLPALDLLITNGLKREDALAPLAAIGFPLSTR